MRPDCWVDDWDCGLEDWDCWRERGASIMVATRPEAMCHSMWQWKSQMRGEGEGC